MARAAELVVLADLHVAGMLRTVLWPDVSRMVPWAGSGPSSPTRLRGRAGLRSPRRGPSSKRCSAYGVIHADLKLAERAWSCDSGGTPHDRDGNAAANLCWLGQLAAGDSNARAPDDARAWAGWSAASRDAIAEWRRARAKPRAFRSDQFVGQAMPDVTRGEIA